MCLFFQIAVTNSWQIFYRSLFADSYALHLPLFGWHPSCVPCVRGWWKCYLCGMTHSSTCQRTHITWLCPVTVQSSEDSLQDTTKHNSVWVTSTLTMSLIPLPIDSASDTLLFTRLCLICSPCRKLLSFIPRFIPLICPESSYCFCEKNHSNLQLPPLEHGLTPFKVILLQFANDFSDIYSSFLWPETDHKMCCVSA